MKPFLLALLVAAAVNAPSFGADTSKLSVRERLLLIDLELCFEQYKEISTELLKVEKEMKALRVANREVLELVPTKDENKEIHRQMEKLKDRHVVLGEMKTSTHNQAESIERQLMALSAPPEAVSDGSASKK